MENQWYEFETSSVCNLKIMTLTYKQCTVEHKQTPNAEYIGTEFLNAQNCSYCSGYKNFDIKDYLLSIVNMCVRIPSALLASIVDGEFSGSLYDLKISKIAKYPTLDSYISTEDICKFCNRFGIPFALQKDYLNVSVKSEKGRTAEISVYYLKWLIAVIAQTFKAWRAYEDNDTQSMILFSKIIGYSPIEFYDCDGKQAAIDNSGVPFFVGSGSQVPLLSTPDIRYFRSREGYARALALVIANRMGAAMWLNFGENGFSLEPSLDTIFHVALYQIACLASNKLRYSEFGKENLKQCDCGNWFVGHGNAKYCGINGCDRHKKFRQVHGTGNTKARREGKVNVNNSKTREHL